MKKKISIRKSFTLFIVYLMLSLTVAQAVFAQDCTAVDPSSLEEMSLGATMVQYCTSPIDLGSGEWGYFAFVYAPVGKKFFLDIDERPMSMILENLQIDEAAQWDPLDPMNPPINVINPGGFMLISTGPGTADLKLSSPDPDVMVSGTSECSLLLGFEATAERFIQLQALRELDATGIKLDIIDDILNIWLILMAATKGAPPGGGTTGCEMGGAGSGGGGGDEWPELERTELNPHEQFKTESSYIDPMVPIEMEGVVVEESFGEDLYDRKFFGPDAIIDAETDLKAVADTYTDVTWIYDVNSKVKLSELMIEALKNDITDLDGFKTDFINKVVSKGVAIGDATTMVETFFSEGRVYFDGMGNARNDAFNTVLVSEVDLINGDTMQRFIEKTTFNGKTSTISVKIEARAPGGVEGPTGGYTAPNIIKLYDVYYLSDLLGHVLPHETAHHYVRDVHDFPPQWDIQKTKNVGMMVVEMPSTKAEMAVPRRLNNLFPNVGFDFFEKHHELFRVDLD